MKRILNVILLVLRYLYFPIAWLFWMITEDWIIHFHPEDGPVADVVQLMLWSCITGYIIGIPGAIIGVLLDCPAYTESNSFGGKSISTAYLLGVFVGLTAVSFVIRLRQ